MEMKTENKLNVAFVGHFWHEKRMRNLYAMFPERAALD